MKAKITFGKYYSEEHNKLMMGLVKRIQGITVVAESKSEENEDVFEVEITDTELPAILEQLDACDIFYFAEVK